MHVDSYWCMHSIRLNIKLAADPCAQWHAQAILALQSSATPCPPRVAPPVPHPHCTCPGVTCQLAVTLLSVFLLPT